ncbi:hypothetical protein K458DRAFT_415797 [Lentithecium fluviatile CBS 122367]|uniref:Uncharacterized protein n=1 Tax=Lentithecium fluviatile CBS 122367 TaxID=1168545 RepID=A0A6G1JBP4_9PLEO|nr:hypothetical protein K458DRAFT_415797 [Lentithecium fluviatile CBS 122367]
MASTSIDQATQTKAIYFGLAAVVVALGVYTLWGSELFPSTKAKSHPTGHGHRKHHYNPKGDPQFWSEDDMKKFLLTRDMAVGHDPSIEELRAMVMSKLHEPKATSFDDPRNWTEAEMKDYLKANNLDIGHHSSRMELLAMVESKMHEPK